MQDLPEKWLHWKLTTDAETATILGFRVYPHIAPQGATRAEAGGLRTFAVYRRTSTNRDTVTLVPSLEAPAVQIQLEVYAETYAAARDAAAVLRRVLHTATGSAFGNTVLYSLHKSESDDIVVPIDGKAMPIYSVLQTYEIRIAETA
jgi:hypothetical protein